MFPRVHRGQHAGPLVLGIGLLKLAGLVVGVMLIVVALRSLALRAEAPDELSRAHLSFAGWLGLLGGLLLILSSVLMLLLRTLR